VETRMGEASEVRFSGSVAGPVDCKHQTYTVKISAGLRFTPNPGAPQVVDLLRRPSSGEEVKTTTPTCAAAGTVALRNRARD
jgi:hypothetical protein